MSKTFLEVTDLPSDTNGTFYGLRTPLVLAFNKAREYPAQMAKFKALIKFIYSQITAFEKEELARQEAVNQQEAELLELEERTLTIEGLVALGIDPDERLSTAKLKAELVAASKAKTA